MKRRKGLASFVAPWDRQGYARAHNLAYRRHRKLLPRVKNGSQYQSPLTWKKVMTADRAKEGGEAAKTLTEQVCSLVFHGLASPLMHSTPVQSYELVFTLRLPLQRPLLMLVLH